MFIDRDAELDALNKRISSKDFELIIVYGRRRIGKSALILEALKGTKGSVYYLATQKNNLEDFRNIAKINNPGIEKLKEDWETYLDALKDSVIVIDEFPNLIIEDNNIVNIFQRAVDTDLSKSKTKLVLLGSSVSIMESKVLSYKSPLYGRRTSSMKLSQMDIFDSRKFFRNINFGEMVEIYGFSGGVPFYLEKVGEDFWKWLREELLASDTFIKSEVDFLLRYEFENITTYKEILEAIALGKTKLNEIKDHVKAKGEITSYIANLISISLVEKRISIFDSPKSKKGRYYIRDNFIKFWFKFISPNLSLIESRSFDLKSIKTGYQAYNGETFENIGESLLYYLLKKSKVFSFTSVGKYWGKRSDRKYGENEFDIDLVALNRDTGEIGFFETKFAELDLKKALSIIEDLKEKSLFVGWRNGKRTEYYGIIAKKVEHKERLRNEGYLVFDFDDFER